MRSAKALEVRRRVAAGPEPVAAGGSRRSSAWSRTCRWCRPRGSRRSAAAACRARSSAGACGRARSACRTARGRAGSPRPRGWFMVSAYPSCSSWRWYSASLSRSACTTSAGARSTKLRRWRACPRRGRSPPRARSPARVEPLLGAGRVDLLRPASSSTTPPVTATVAATSPGLVRELELRQREAISGGHAPRGPPPRAAPGICAPTGTPMSSRWALTAVIASIAGPAPRLGLRVGQVRRTAPATAQWPAGRAGHRRARAGTTRSPRSRTA